MVQRILRQLTYIFWRGCINNSYISNRNSKEKANNFENALSPLKFSEESDQAADKAQLQSNQPQGLPNLTRPSSSNPKQTIHSEHSTPSIQRNREVASKDLPFPKKTKFTKSKILRKLSKGYQRRGKTENLIV